ncbi:MAG: hypothetical protein RMX96_04670 [Nostoc sp. ChiSLP02]|nr:hypothetical protein [Nostoc sp. DedSLP05]MDZ8102847.1 hypothetical protein [Nostoc sp. DedSLP01]MDZ8184142.1 hypothetical protein [Nostoc sp. ChiSLP02]
MVSIASNTVSNNQRSLNTSKKKQKKHFQIIEKTYNNNTDSDYTEKIEALGKNFDYSSNSNYFWGEPELSTLYGTPLYEQASTSQKLALNHLYWVGQYQHTAASESNTMLYNQVTSGVFTKLGGYQTLCQELDLETNQEKSHITTFQRIGYKTKVALLGKQSLGNTLHKKLAKSNTSLLGKFKLSQNKEYWSSLQESTFRAITKLMHRQNADYYSQFLEERGVDRIPTTTDGLAGVTASISAFKFLTLNWGSSPFMAAQYYSARMIANMSLKAYEHRFFRQFRELERKNQFIPAPLQVSYYHLLDEAFHTTMSNVISQEVYKDFPKPTAYEKLLSNMIIYRLQGGLLNGLSAVLPVTFRDDASFMTAYYRLLTSPLFGMSSRDAIHWLEKCLCQEHEGFHLNLKYHQDLLFDMQKFFGRLDYLWPVNREMRLMAAGGSIEQAIQRNKSAFVKFAGAVV